MCVNVPVYVVSVRTKLHQQGSQLEELERQKTDNTDLRQVLKLSP